MEWSKLKNIIIVILLAANLFLLAMAGMQERDAAQYQAQAVEDALVVLERNGITVAREVIPGQMALRSMTVQRERELETELARALLGDCTLSDLGGGRYSYVNPMGSAEFRSNGNFSIVFPKGIPLAEDAGGEVDHALAIAAQIGLTGMVAEQVQTADGAVQVKLYQTWQEVPIYSCQITMQYQGGALCSISGQRLMGQPQLTGSEEQLLAIPTVLVRSLNGINDLGDICSEITQMTPGYQMSNSAEGTRMEPVWYIMTDIGAYQLNAITGILVRT